MLYNILFESKQAITNLGFPEIISSILYEKYGNKAFLIAKWFKDDNSYHSNEYNQGQWWKSKYDSFSSTSRVGIYVKFYNAAKISLEEYNKIRKESDFRVLENYDKLQTLTELKEAIKKEFFEDSFFTTNNIIKAIDDGTLKILQPYKDLSFNEANEKFEEKKIFRDKKPIKKYKNGWRWVDVGKRCSVVGRKMRNCGSAGVMSQDEDRTILSLFDEHDNPHVVVTYSPNEKRLSGIESAGGTEVKDEYIDYVLDLSKAIQVPFDVSRLKNRLLSLKYQFENSLNSIQTVGQKDSMNGYKYLLQMKDGKKFYSDIREFVSKEDFDSIDFGTLFPDIGDDLNSKLIAVFNHYKQDEIKWKYPNIKFINDYQFRILYNANPGADRLYEHIFN